MMKRIIAMIAAVAMLLCLAGCKNDADKNNDGEKVNVEEKVLQSENFSFDLGEATYLFERYFIDFYNNNAQYISFYGIDIEKSLKEQEYTKDVTWFDYFAEQAETYMNELLVFCEAAKASGKELDENDVAEIDSIIKEFEDEAEGNGYKSVNELVSEMYGDIVTIDDVRSFIEKEKLAFKHYNAIVESYTFTEEEENTYLSENPDEFYCVDYVYYIFDEDDDRDAKYNAKELKDTADSDAFYAYIENYETEVLKLDEEEKVGSKESKYVLKDGEVGNWAFAAEIGDKYVDENTKDGIYTVYMLTSKPALQEYNVRDIRYICLTKDTYQTNEKTKAKAEKILGEWDETEKTPEDFGKLAEIYSEDENSSGNGGLYKNVDKSNSILSDEGMKWLFEDAQVGDVTVLKGEGMYYILYLENIGKPQWRVAADNYMGEDQYAEDSEKMVDTHKVEVFEDVIKKIDK
ncbi:MAG: peptidylprolyl isomerase [Clostridia bacterium]|nr:peptidylprolyl isomerase [Clostridia bacterium]